MGLVGLNPDLLWGFGLFWGLFESACLGMFFLLKNGISWMCVFWVGWMKDKVSLCLLALFISSFFLFGLPFLDGLFGQDRGAFYSLLLSIGLFCSFIGVYSDYRHKKSSS